MNSYHIIDVSQWMDDFIFPGNPAFSLTGPFNRVSGSNPEFVYDFTSCSQSGTHIQGPHYFLESGAKIDAFPIDTFEGNAIVVDLNKRGVDTTAVDFRDLLQGSDTSASILIMRTGNMDEIIRTGRVDDSNCPGISLDAARYLVEECQFKMLAIDSIGFESRVTKNYEVNVYLCSQGILLLEGLVNLAAISHQNVFLEAFPLKLRGVEGTPCRAIVKEMIENPS
ncbi:cyclase family protein [Aestuariirhabdus sp. Z084]|uniref:cyclase family protein n=1 Tax=Aestuariirhabdus haliotis TaxID=2918751 RepID=UPI00201B3C8D|nr:cyclase family protein [Aestuariirhabdus haliotis]MCL6416240.1 cyclase family protein [Aestuariirhabdus haliotis]MCL6420300.1 cyclase family protein [Aestuariirhabdus haliotis]